MCVCASREYSFSIAETGCEPFHLVVAALAWPDLHHDKKRLQMGGVNAKPERLASWTMDGLWLVSAVDLAIHWGVAAMAGGFGDEFDAAMYQ